MMFNCKLEIFIDPFKACMKNFFCMLGKFNHKEKVSVLQQQL